MCNMNIKTLTFIDFDASGEKSPIIDVDNKT